MYGSDLRLRADPAPRLLRGRRLLRARARLLFLFLVSLFERHKLAHASGALKNCP